MIIKHDLTVVKLGMGLLAVLVVAKLGMGLVDKLSIGPSLYLAVVKLGTTLQLVMVIPILQHE